MAAARCSHVWQRSVSTVGGCLRHFIGGLRCQLFSAAASDVLVCLQTGHKVSPDLAQDPRTAATDAPAGRRNSAVAGTIAAPNGKGHADFGDSRQGQIVSRQESPAQAVHSAVDAATGSSREVSSGCVIRRRPGSCDCFADPGRFLSGSHGGGFPLCPMYRQSLRIHLSW